MAACLENTLGGNCWRGISIHPMGSRLRKSYWLEFRQVAAERLGAGGTMPPSWFVNQAGAADSPCTSLLEDEWLLVMTGDLRPCADRRRNPGVPLDGPEGEVLYWVVQGKDQPRHWRHPGLQPSHGQGVEHIFPKLGVGPNRRRGLIIAVWRS